jgi:hypothetical protein
LDICFLGVDQDSFPFVSAARVVKILDDPTQNNSGREVLITSLPKVLEGDEHNTDSNHGGEPEQSISLMIPRRTAVVGRSSLSKIIALRAFQRCQREMSITPILTMAGRSNFRPMHHGWRCRPLETDT